MHILGTWGRKIAPVPLSMTGAGFVIFGSRELMLDRKDANEWKGA
jgi:hypothetical protein